MDNKSNECTVRKEYKNIVDMQEAFKNAGISIPESPPRIEKKAQSTQMKIDEAYKIVSRLDKYTLKYSGAPDEEEENILRDAIMTKFNELTQFIKDIACIIFNYSKQNKNVQDVDKVSLRWSIRQIESILYLSKEQENCLDNFNLRNEAVHDYMNSDINKNDVVKFFMGSNRIKALNEIIKIIEIYCIDNKII